jgi:hypothetical protein
MARKPKSERILLPADAREIKAWFKNRADADAVVKEIQEHVKRTGQTFWRGHTHTKPPPGATPVYVGEFVLPKKLRKVGRFVPCPCCTEEFAKFGEGMIAWFPEEGVIRLIGPDCFRALNPEGHENAKYVYKKEKKVQGERNFLLGRLDKIAEVLARATKALVVAEAVETFHRNLHNRFKTFDLDLWKFAKDGGGLSIRVAGKEFRNTRAGDVRLIESERERVAYRLHGYKMLNETSKGFVRRLEKSIEALKPYDFGEDWRSRVDLMSDIERNAAIRIISKETRSIHSVISDIADVRQFASPVEINTLRSWGEDEWCVTRVVFRHNGKRIHVGKYPTSLLAVEIPDSLDSELANIDFFIKLLNLRERDEEEGITSSSAAA